MRFRYTAVDSQGQPLSGEVDDVSLAAARESLERHGLQVSELKVLVESAPVLTATEAFAVAQHVTAATHSDLPLVGSLRAFSEEVVSPRLRDRLARVCDLLERGEALEKVLVDPELRLPRSIGSILGSGLPHTAMNHLLSLSVRAASTSADLNIRAALLLTYPILMFGALGAFWLFLLVYVTPQFGSIYADFGTQISPFLQQLLYFSALLSKVNWLVLVVSAPTLALAAFAVFRLCLSAVTRQRIWCGLPVVGAMYRLTSLSEFARLLAVMLETYVPLPQALSWAALGANDADLKERTDAVIVRLRSGEDPVAASQQVSGLPAYYEQILRFAAQGPSGAEPLRSMAKLMESRAKSLSQIAMPLMEPMVEMAAVLSIAAYALTVFPPLIKLLNDLA